MRPKLTDAQKKILLDQYAGLIKDLDVGFYFAPEDLLRVIEIASQKISLLPKEERTYESACREIKKQLIANLRRSQN